MRAEGNSMGVPQVLMTPLNHREYGSITERTVMSTGPTSERTDGDVRSLVSAKDVCGSGGGRAAAAAAVVAAGPTLRYGGGGQ